MFITLEEMEEIKANYEKQIVELNRKVEVVNDFIAIAKEKDYHKSEENAETEEIEAQAEEVQPVATASIF
jgi:hypothetical protein